MKYAVILGDGMADYPLTELGGLTPLEKAHIPTADMLAKKGILGLVKTIPENMSAGSDVANLSVLGYDPRLSYNGRSPFEAESMGISLEETDIAFRCNLVTLTEEEKYQDRTILDHSAGEITSEEGAILIEHINKELGRENLTFHPGVSYRHLLIWKGGPDSWELTPPHDILGRKVGEYLPRGVKCQVIQEMMRKSALLLAEHPVNKERRAKGLLPANSIWIWGEGKKPILESFTGKFGLRGAVISAVDLVRGLGVCTGLSIVEVPGATGNFHTNYRGKAEAALRVLGEGKDFVYIHIEAPDECGHRNELANKVRAIELIDENVVKPIADALEKTWDEYSIMFLPDHATPLSLRTHTRDPVPFLIYRNTKEGEHPGRAFSEKAAAETGIFLEEGHHLMEYFLAIKGVRSKA